VNYDHNHISDELGDREYVDEKIEELTNRIKWLEERVEVLEDANHKLQDKL
jgi:hypothetical protein